MIIDHFARWSRQALQDGSQQQYETAREQKEIYQHIQLFVNFIITIIFDPGTSFPGCETLSKVCGVWNSYNGDSEIVKVLDRQTALKRWIAAEIRWYRNVVAQRCSPANLGDKLVCLVCQDAKGLHSYGVEHVAGCDIAVLGRLSFWCCWCCTTGFHIIIIIIKNELIIVMLYEVTGALYDTTPITTDNAIIE